MLWTRLAGVARTSPACAAWRVFQVFDGALTFAKAKTMHELAFDVPLERLLLASAAPRKLPTQAAGGRRAVCHPGHLLFTAERLVEIKRGGVELRELVEASRENARHVFGL